MQTNVDRKQNYYCLTEILKTTYVQTNKLLPILKSYLQTMHLQIPYLIYMNKENMTLKIIQGLIWHKPMNLTQVYIYIYIYILDFIYTISIEAFLQPKVSWRFINDNHQADNERYRFWFASNPQSEIVTINSFTIYIYIYILGVFGAVIVLNVWRKPNRI